MSARPRFSFRDRLGLAAAALLNGTRLGNALGAFFLNRYEGAQPVSPDRSFLPAFVRDARYDANSFTRWELCRKIRYFERNVWLVQRLRDEHVKWTVGPNGMPVIPDSGDEDWNKYMLEAYLDWCESPCLDATLTMPQVHHQIAGGSHLEGEMFINLTRLKQPGSPSRPAVQLIESHRVSSPGMQYSARDSDDVVDGVQLGPDGSGQPARAIGYWVRDSLAGDAWTFRSTVDMHHVFDPVRPGMFRDITPYHACLNTLHDLDDLEQMEMQRAKLNSEVAYWIKTASGELDPENITRLARYGTTRTTPSGSSTDQFLAKRLEMFRQIMGARVATLRSNEDVKQFSSESPSASTQWYWRYKIGQVCAATSVPLILVFPELIEDTQGTLVRGIYDNAHLFFRGKSFLYAHAARRMYRYFANWARYNITKLADAPADWAKCHVILPRAVNVDVGRNSAAMLAELAAGTTNYDDVYGAAGSTAMVGLRKKALNVAAIKKIAAEVSNQTGVTVEPAEIAAPLADILQKLAQAQAAAAPPDSQDNPDGQPRRRSRPEPPQPRRRPQPEELTNYA